MPSRLVKHTSSCVCDVTLGMWSNKLKGENDWWLVLSSGIVVWVNKREEGRSLLCFHKLPSTWVILETSFCFILLLSPAGIRQNFFSLSMQTHTSNSPGSLNDFGLGVVLNSCSLFFCSSFLDRVPTRWIFLLILLLYRTWLNTISDPFNAHQVF